MKVTFFKGVSCCHCLYGMIQTQDLFQISIWRGRSLFEWHSRKVKTRLNPFVLWEKSKRDLTTLFYCAFLYKPASNASVKRKNMVDQIAHCWLPDSIPLGGRRVPLCSGLTAREVDSRETKLISAECSDLVLRGCTRGCPAPSAGLFY